MGGISAKVFNHIGREPDQNVDILREAWLAPNAAGERADNVIADFKPLKHINDIFK